MSETPCNTNLVVTRVFNASPDQVWSAWSESEQVMRWWGPLGFTCPEARMDFREGVTSLVCMRAPQAFGGQDYYNTWSYETIEPLRRIVYTLYFTDKGGTTVSPESVGLPSGMPQGVRHEVTFRALDQGNTELTVTEYDWPVGPLLEMSRMGLEQCLDKMATIFCQCS